MKTIKLKLRMSVLFIVALLSTNGNAQYTGGFAVPAWDSTARWVKTPERFAGSLAGGFWLEGATSETMMGGQASRAPKIFDAPEDGPYGFFMRDLSVNDRTHVITGSSVRGYLDGPFSRARFGSWHYMANRRTALVGHYYFFNEPENEGVVRRLDLRTQTVTTIATQTKTVSGMCADTSGNLYLTDAWVSGLEIISADGNSRIQQLATDEGIRSMSIDEKHKRLYIGCGYPVKAWYVIYFDLSDFSFHGVLPYSGTNLRARNEAGPFEGTNLYPEIGVSFGPDDPDYRYLYVGPNDTWMIFRLDLEARWMWASDWSGETVKFISSGNPGKAPKGWSTGIDQQTTDLLSLGDGPAWRYKRIK